MKAGRFPSGLLHGKPAPDGGIPSIGEIGLNQFAPYLLNRLSAIWNLQVQEALKDFNLTTTKMRVLATLCVSSGLTINELATYAVTEQSTMSRTLDALEEQGLIRRRARPDDMRVREIHITEDGRETFTQFWPSFYAMYNEMFSGIDESEFRAFIATLHKLLHNLDQQNL